MLSICLKGRLKYCTSDSDDAVYYAANLRGSCVSRFNSVKIHCNVVCTYITLSCFGTLTFDVHDLSLYVGVYCCVSETSH